MLFCVCCAARLGIPTVSSYYIRVFLLPAFRTYRSAFNHTHNPRAVHCLHPTLYPALHADIINVNVESTSSDPDGVVMDETGIAWPSDTDKFIQVDGFKSYKWPEGVQAVTCTAAGLPDDCRTYTEDGQSWSFYYPSEEKHQYLYEAYPSQISPIKGVTDEHFMVWMRTAALPNFRKLYGIIDQNFRKNDELIFDINANFEVDSFSGSKSIVIAQVGEFGGKNAYLGIAYIVVGCISLMFALLFVTKQIISPRSVADPSLLNWS